MQSFARLLKLAGLLCVFLLAITGIAAASASAEEQPEFLLHVTNNLFTTEGGEGELVDLTSGLAIKCKKNKGSGSVVGPKTVIATVSFEKCNVGGLAAQSLGDKGGVILLAKLAGKLCTISTSPLHVGILLTLPAEGVHIEVPSLGQLLVVTGGVVGLLSPINVDQTGPFTLTFVDPNEKCEGATGEEDVLLVELEHNGKPLVGAEVAKETVNFTETIEVMG